MDSFLFLYHYFCIANERITDLSYLLQQHLFGRDRTHYLDCPSWAMSQCWQPFIKLRQLSRKVIKKVRPTNSSVHILYNGPCPGPCLSIFSHSKGGQTSAWKFICNQYETMLISYLESTTKPSISILYVMSSMVASCTCGELKIEKWPSARQGCHSLVRASRSILSSPSSTELSSSSLLSSSCNRVVANYGHCLHIFY